MKQPARRRKSGWFWIGVALLPVVAILWLVLIPAMVAEPNTGNIIFVMIFLTLLTAVPVGIMVYGVYGVRHGKKEPAVEIKLAPERRSKGSRDKVQKFFSTLLRPPRQEQVRDNIYGVLQRLGIHAAIAPSGIGPAMIDILGGPIQWVNVRLEGTSEAGVSSYYTEYGVPDYRLGPELHRLQIHSVRIRTFPLIGKVIDLQWKGKDRGLGIIGRLSSDISIKHPIMRSRNLAISTNNEQRCWILSTKTRDAPSEELWNCYSTIARHLLAEWSLSV